MAPYYSAKLAGHRLRRCYEIAPPAVQAYLKAEIDFVIGRVHSSDYLLELGCGYGRALATFLPHVKSAYGIDTSLPSLLLARESLRTAMLAAANASSLCFPDKVFDVVVCIQNGLSAFAIDPPIVIREAIRVIRPGGMLLLSSYAESFWPHRLEWFEMQVAEGLLGEIDYQATYAGQIVCKDGFRATTIGPDQFRQLAAAAGMIPKITEVAQSSIFCELRVR